MKNQKIIDHLFRHQYGKMVSILTRIFGLRHLEIIEDAVQDTFAQAVVKWRSGMPDNPEAWLTKSAKNRAIDLFRKIKATDNRLQHFNNGTSVIAINNLFLDHEVEDSQLSMIFIACHPFLNPKDQITFALKTISGFSTKEIAAALLTKESSIKKRILRARKNIKEQNIKFEFPDKEEIPQRLERVLEVLYLIFNEGFHSARKDILVRKDLCGEALRLCKMILKKPLFRSGSVYSLFALMCFLSARLESKVNDDNEIIDMEHQDRKKWYIPLMDLGADALSKSLEYSDRYTYTIEALVALEHLKAKSFKDTNWSAILELYEKLHALQPTPFTQLTMAVVHIQLKNYEKSYNLLVNVIPETLEQRQYLYYGTMANYYKHVGKQEQALRCYDKALDTITNELERNYINKKKEVLKRAKT